ncbi:MAG TPA: class E sortase [Nocardioides sp.]|uniref:class E sortase n=1 Tax=Nocardioides sp. TaxID=35761 RepID=UPI002D7F99EC|nr:class E sortase [Nocardioides sp.]HET6652073.1 class E sortase [Nocardioides sp.]
MGSTGPVGAVVALLLAACSPEPAQRPEAGTEAAGRATTTPASRSPTTQPESAAPDPRTTVPAAPRVREPRRSFLTIPALGIRSFPVVRYRGTPDDGPGTVIQNSGPMASPRGPGGGVGPGVVGNFIVTGHRTSHTAPFAELPFLQAGDRVLVRSGMSVLVYEITGTRETSFRSAASKARQVAPVPGRPGARATKAMITLSTCATPEDHAAGNFWFDRFGNPEHRIDKIGVLVERRPAA